MPTATEFVLDSEQVTVGNSCPQLEPTPGDVQPAVPTTNDQSAIFGAREVRYE
ncbi:MAG TPA: hypothetical protein VFJ06_09495 [Halococcus sp.]|nr:hypothetical protein [Halococcus sp.]